MNRKRRISILAGMTLSLATFAGPAAALDAVTTDGDTVEAELADTTVTLEADEDPTLEASSDDETVTLDPSADEPVETTLVEDDSDGSDPVEETTETVGDVLEEDDGTTPSGGDGDVRSADSDGTVAADSPSSTTDSRSSFDISALDAQAAHRYGSAYQRPTPAATAAQPEQSDELAPVVAPPAADEEAIELASTPVTDPESPPFALKVFASLLVAGTAMSWWNAREAVGVHTQD